MACDNKNFTCKNCTNEKCLCENKKDCSCKPESECCCCND